LVFFVFIYFSFYLVNHTWFRKIVIQNTLKFNKQKISEKIFQILLIEYLILIMKWFEGVDWPYWSWPLLFDIKSVGHVMKKLTQGIRKVLTERHLWCFYVELIGSMGCHCWTVEVCKEGRWALIETNQTCARLSYR
jgi:hypothetical protein